MDDGTLLKRLKTHFGYSNFKSISQRNAIKAAIEGKYDIFVSMPTGSGKSLCFQLPGVLQENKVTIVFTSFLSSIKDQIHHLSKLNISAASINSHTGCHERRYINDNLKSPNPTIKFLYLTPEQVAYQTELIETLVNSGKVAYIVVDEAYFVSRYYSSRHGFRPDFSKLSQIRTKYPDIPWIVLTAAASNEVIDDIFNKLKLKKPIVTFQTSSFRENLYYDVVIRNIKQHDLKHLKEYIMEFNKNMNRKKSGEKVACGIIYCKTHEDVENMVEYLNVVGIPATSYHRHMEPFERIESQEEWTSGLCPVICATECFNMVDKASVQFVIHWDVPRNLFTYYLESGRAGRDGQQAFCRIYFSDCDAQILNFTLQNRINNSESPLEKEEAEIAKKQFENVIEYCKPKLCRHKSFSQCFDDSPPHCVDRCDVCKESITEPNCDIKEEVVSVDEIKVEKEENLIIALIDDSDGSVTENSDSDFEGRMSLTNDNPYNKRHLDNKENKDISPAKRIKLDSSEHANDLPESNFNGKDHAKEFQHIG